MKKNVKRINESQLKKMIETSIKKALNEGTTDQEVIDKWNYLKDTIGPKVMLDCIFHWSSSDQLGKYIEWFEEEEYL